MWSAAFFAKQLPRPCWARFSAMARDRTRPLKVRAGIHRHPKFNQRMAKAKEKLPTGK
jgi:hypothetical protein